MRCFVAAAALAAVCSAEEAKAEEAATEAQPEAAATEGAEAAAEPEPVVLNCNANGEQLRGPPARARARSLTTRLLLARADRQGRNVEH